MPAASSPAKDASGPAKDASSEPKLLLAQPWDNDADLTGWWMSEKLDGVRAWWDGKQFLSRQGNIYHAPDWFVAGLPAAPLDGELWLDRKAFQRTVSIVRRQDKSDHWREIKYLMFDAPAVAGPFEERQKALADLIAQHRPEFAKVLEQQRCKGVKSLKDELARIEALGGEGLMLRQPGSAYEAGRSFTLLKVKTFHDAEGRVIEHLPGKGRHKGRLGARSWWNCPTARRSPSAPASAMPSANNPPAIGSTITYRYQELTDRGVPRFPSFVASGRNRRNDDGSSAVLGEKGVERLNRSMFLGLLGRGVREIEGRTNPGGFRGNWPCKRIWLDRISRSPGGSRRRQGRCRWRVGSNM